MISFFKNINPDFYNEKSIVTASKIVEWKKHQGVYSFNKLPKTAILTPTTNFFSGFKKLFNKKAKGLSGKNYFLNDDFLLSFNFGDGASAIVAHIEELKSLGIENFIFIGFAGILNTTFNENETHLITKAFSVSGTSFFYDKNEEINYSTDYSDNLKLTLNLQENICLSTDVPFRETNTLLEHYKNKGATLIDMESASILAVSKFYSLNCACILIASDKIENSTWFPPKNMKNLIAKIDEIITKIIAK